MHTTTFAHKFQVGDLVWTHNRGRVVQRRVTHVGYWSGFLGSDGVAYNVGSKHWHRPEAQVFATRAEALAALRGG